MSTKRENIIKAAAKLFKEKGFAATSMRDLADSLEVSAPGLYNHIRSKDDILDEICFRVAHKFVVHINDIDSSELSNIQKLTDVIGLHVRMMIESPEETTVANSEWKNLSAPKREVYKQLRDSYEAKIAHLIQDGMHCLEFRKVHVPVAVYTLLSALRWIESWYKPERNITPEQLEKEVTALLVGGFLR